MCRRSGSSRHKQAVLIVLVVVLGVAETKAVHGDKSGGTGKRFIISLVVMLATENVMYSHM